MLKKDAVKPYPTTIALIEKLAKEGFILGAGSSSRRAKEYLRSFGIIRHFTAIIDGNMVIGNGGRIPGKPSGEFFREVAKLMKVFNISTKEIKSIDPKYIVVFEDSPAGVQSAKAGGFGMVIALDRGGDYEKLKEAGADHILPDIGDLSIEEMQHWFKEKNNESFTGVIFDVDGVISNTNSMHFDSWKKVLDSILEDYTKITGVEYKKFSQEDYVAYFAGQTGESVVDNFLQSRMINLNSIQLGKNDEAMASKNEIRNRAKLISYDAIAKGVKLQSLREFFIKFRFDTNFKCPDPVLYNSLKIDNEHADSLIYDIFSSFGKIVIKQRPGNKKWNKSQRDSFWAVFRATMDYVEQKEDEQQQRLGGIDLTPSKMNLQTQNSTGEIKFHMDPAMLQQLQNAPGFVPVIINIQPMTNLRVFLGINDPVRVDKSA
jgi:beta-phosphoglucomutase-like phosphatase (HAD superfamily)